MKAYRWQVVVLLFLASVINYLDRSALSVAAPMIAKDLGLGPEQLGFIFSAFFVGYVLFNIAGGLLVDRVGAWKMLGISMALWSLLCASTALATGFWSLLLLRVVFGMAEGPLATSANKMVSNWFPKRQAATAIGTALSGSPLGSAIAGPFIGLLAVNFGWRLSFVIAGVIGLVWMAFWFARLSERPRSHPRVSAEEVAEIEADQPPVTRVTGPAPSLLSQLAQPVVAATTVAFFGYNYILYFFLTWFPVYLTNARNLSVHDMSIMNVLPWALGFVGLATGGRVVDWVRARTGKPMLAAKLVLAIGLGVAAIAAALAGQVTTAFSAVALVSVATFFLYLTGSTFWVILQNRISAAQLGGVGGIMHGVANCSGIIGPALTGLIVARTSVGYAGAFALAGALGLIAALVVAVVVRDTRADLAGAAA